MSDSHRVIHLYCEDVGHESFVRPLIKRLVRDANVAAHLEVQSGRGGAGRAVTELRGWQLLYLGGRATRPDLLLIVLDGNCTGANEKRREILDLVSDQAAPDVVVGIADPHVERWMLADGEAFRQVVGKYPPADPGKCERGAYKRILAASAEEAGTLVLTTPMQDLAPDFVEVMNLYRAEKQRPDLGRFMKDIKAVLRKFRETSAKG